ncbi:MAG: hypothetical protein Q8P99_03070 [bacterium]|nr:hypothetical protein [bacterium]MDZ4231332.1 hypothetical protein [Patescibacteria group bacterium]
MREEQLIKQLTALRGVEPDANFARGVRSKILYGSEPKPARFFGLAQSLSTTLSMGLVILFFAFLALGGVATLLRHPAFPTFQGVNEQSLASEAGDINENIDVRLGEVNYLTNVSYDSKLAKASRAEDWVILEGANTDEEIDILLTQAKEY